MLRIHIQLTNTLMDSEGEVVNFGFKESRKPTDLSDK
jgi:hypothetical protein